MLLRVTGREPVMDEVGDMADDRWSWSDGATAEPPKSSLEMLLRVKCLDGDSSESFIALSSSNLDKYPLRFRWIRSVTSSTDSESASAIISAINSFDLSAASRLNLLMMSISLDRSSNDSFRLSSGLFAFPFPVDVSGGCWCWCE